MPPHWELPSHRKTEFHSRKNRFALLIPILNEGDRIRNQLRRLQPYLTDLDLFITDGGSTDGVTDESFLQNHRVRTLIVKTGPGKLGAQLRIGLACCLEDGYEGVICMDGNDKDGEEALPNFIHSLQEGYDFIQGSRFAEGGAAINTPKERYLAIKLLHVPIIRAASGYNFTDSANGFKAFSRSYLLDPRVVPFRHVLSGYNLQTYLTIRAPQLGFKTKEIPVRRGYPEKGGIPTKITGLEGRVDFFKEVVFTALGKYHP